MISQLISAFIQAFAKHMLTVVINKIMYETHRNFLTFRVLRLPDHQLEAHPIETNEQLLAFDVRSKEVSWKNLVTPLLDRGPVRYLNDAYDDLGNHGVSANLNNQREVLVCHDMMGNYLADRHFSSSRKWDDYRFYHWAGIDYFCYFSHNYITIPPSNWISAAHLHGVRVLGTFITEGSGSRLLNEVLESREKIHAVVESLVKLCEHFCFEGWLVNIECSVNPSKVESLIYFVSHLKMMTNYRIRNGVVFWYDSVIMSGELSWQNEINERNLNFFNVSDGTLVNYSWTDSSLRKTEETVNREGRKQENVFFGIDVFARGQVAKFHSHRTLAKIVRYNFSVGIFAPAWTYEGLRERGYDLKNPEGDDDVNESFLLRNEKFWGLLWKHLATHSIFKLPFFTDFCLGSGKYTFAYGRKVDGKFFSLSRQSLQPSVPLKDNAEHCFDYGVNGGSCLRIVTFNRPFRLFLTEFHVNGALIFAYASKVNDPICDIDCILVLTNEFKSHSVQLICGNYENSQYPGFIYAKPVDHKTFQVISQILNEKRLPLKLPYHMDYGWNVRYYLIHFDEAVIVQDIGVNLRTPLTQPEGYLGAIYLHSLKDYMRVPSSFSVNMGLNFVRN